MRGRHITTGITLLVLLGILVFGVAYGVQSLLAPVKKTPSAAPTPTCRTETVTKGAKLRSRQIQVSVFNAGSTSGLADKTVLALERRGFVKGEIGNAPVSAKVKRVQVWTTEEKDPAAKLVARQFGKKTKVRVKSTDLGTGIDVVIGDGYKKLRKAPRRVKVRSDLTFCAPTPAALSG